MAKLRPYQQDCVEAVKKDLLKSGASLCVLPTASGKSHIIAAVAALAQPVLILQPSRELLDQNRAKLALVVPEAKIGVYSASFGKKEIKQFTFATIQSVYTKPELFKHIPLVIIDECHQVQLRSLGSMYGKFLKGMGNPKIIGTTATCFRQEIGYFRHPNGDLEAITMLKMLPRMRHKSQSEMFWKRVIFDVSHGTLLEQGYLCPLEYIYEPLVPYEEIPINTSRSDFNLEAYAKSVVGMEAQILNTIAEAQKKYKSVLVFCATTTQATHLSSVVVGSAVVTANTPPKGRQKIVDDFKNGKIKTVFNMGIFTTGFDKPDLECILLLRPTRSLVLYQQMIGRLVRIAPGKTKGVVIDFTGTVKNLGRIETFEMYQNERGLWNLRTEKHDSWHDRPLYSFIV